MGEQRPQIGKWPTRHVEWPTLGLVIACYLAFGVGTTVAADLWLPLGMAVVGVAMALHSSLSHEVLHGHPFKNSTLNAALVFPAIGIFVPYLRFKDTHLDHHLDSRLTDPYDDPESNYLYAEDWDQLPAWRQRLLLVNNTLIGRLLIGPLVGQVGFMHSDIKAIRAGDRRVLAGCGMLRRLLWWSGGWRPMARCRSGLSCSAPTRPYRS